MATATKERTAAIERSVYLYAFEVLLHNLVNTRLGDPTFVDWPDQFDIEEVEVSFGNGVSGGAAFDELWPTEADLDSPEYRAASARCDSILAALFAEIATEDGRNFCVESAARFARIAEKRLAEGKAA